jgi:hypothetical protein
MRASTLEMREHRRRWDLRMAERRERRNAEKAEALALKEKRLDDIRAALRRLGDPRQVTIDALGVPWRPRTIREEMKAVGYERLVNPDTRDGSWAVGGKKRVLYHRPE